MQLKDPKYGYGWISIALHWIGAVFIIFLYFDGEAMEHANIIEEAARKADHISIGMLAFLFLAVRIFWRWHQGEKPLPPTHPLLDMLAKAVPKLLLLSIVILIISGPLLVWSKGATIHVFDFISIPSPIGSIHDLHEVMEELHEIAAHSVIYLTILHTIGALKHFIIDRDGIMQGIFIPRK